MGRLINNLMKLTSIAVIAALFVTESQAIRLTKSCPDDGRDKDVKIIQGAMDRFAAKHEEVASRINNENRTADALKEAEKKEDEETSELKKEVEKVGKDEQTKKAKDEADKMDTKLSKKADEAKDAAAKAGDAAKEGGKKG